MFFAVNGYTSPNYGVQILKRTGTGNSATFANFQFLAVSNSAATSALRFSRSGTYLAVGNNAAPHLRIYKYDADTGTFVAINQPPSGGVQPNNTVAHLAWAYDDSFVAASISSSAFLYERSGDTFTHRATITNSYNNFGGFHPSGNFFITGGGNIYRKITASNWQFVSSVNLSPGSSGTPSTYPAYGSTFSPLITS